VLSPNVAIEKACPEWILQGYLILAALYKINIGTGRLTITNNQITHGIF
jgi:hypothetical protein